MAEAKFYAYVHRKADTGEVFYVGKGKGRRAWSTANRNLHWHRVADKHGWTAQIVAFDLSETEAFNRERALIALHRAANLRIVNMTDGGDGVSGLKRAPDTEETRSKKRSSALGRRMSQEAISKTVAFHTGRKRGADTLAKMSAALRGKNVGRVHSEQALAKMAAAATGRKHSDETRAKMSAKAKGSTKRPQTPEHRAKIAQKRREYWERWRAEKAASA